MQESERLTQENVIQDKYEKVLLELDSLHRGVFDDTEAKSVAALCLQAKIGLIKKMAHAESMARGLKSDVSFAKADAYIKIREENQGQTGAKKLTQDAFESLILKDEEVRKLTHEQNTAEKEARELSQLLQVLSDAHLTFRALIKAAQY